ncbi:MAG: YwiC-like family protein [Elusimicrobiota bacterium]
MKLMLPREHGSWAVLLAPIAVGIAAAHGGPPLAVFLFCCAAFGGFLLRPPLQAIFFQKRVEPGAWSSACLSALLAAGGMLPLLIFYRRTGLLGFAVPAAGLLAIDLVVQRGKRSFGVVSELSGILILCLGAPAAYYAARGSLSADAWCAWFLSVLYFTGPIFHVKMAALQHRAAGDPGLAGELSRMRITSLIFHAAALSIAIAGAIASKAPPLAILPFAAGLAKTWRRGMLPTARVDFRKLGYQEVGYSVFFASALAAGYLLT